MLARRLRRRSNIEPTLAKRLVFTWSRSEKNSACTYLNRVSGSQLTRDVHPMLVQCWDSVALYYKLTIFIITPFPSNSKFNVEQASQMLARLAANIGFWLIVKPSSDEYIQRFLCVDSTGEVSL